MNIYTTQIQYLYKEDYQKIKKGEQLELEASNEVFCSSLEKALLSLKEELKEYEEDDDIDVIRVVVCEIKLDDKEAESKTSYYDKNLNYLGTFDFDAVIEQSKFSKGDWVYFIQGGRLMCGLIDAPPSKDEPALIIYEENNINDCSPHDHTQEINIFAKITEKEAAELLPRKYFEGIKRRFREYNK